jgi:hypothetical protein
MNPTTSVRVAQALFRAKPFHVKYPHTLNRSHISHAYEDGIERCSETFAFKLQTPGNNPEESIRYMNLFYHLKILLIAYKKCV